LGRTFIEHNIHLVTANHYNSTNLLDLGQPQIKMGNREPSNFQIELKSKLLPFQVEHGIAQNRTPIFLGSPQDLHTHPGEGGRSIV
jgi:hypothetical protein